MTKRSSLRFLLALSATMVVPGTGAAGLSSYRWKNRLLLVTTTPDRHGKTAVSLKQNRAGLLDRDLVVIDLSDHDKRLPQSVRPAPEDLESLRSQYGLSGEPRDAFLLIGKDGGLKGRQTGELRLDRYFALIDTMPMRKEEMRQRR